MVEVEGFTKGITEDSTQMLATIETTDSFMQVDNISKATEGLMVETTEGFVKVGHIMKAIKSLKA